MSDTTLLHYAPAGRTREISVQASDGCPLTLHVLRESAGPRSHDHTTSGGAPVFFMHALAMDGHMWQSTAEAVATLSLPGALGAMYALDCRGHGRSGSAPAVSFTPDRFAEDMASALDAAGEAAAHVVGCSMGGTVSLAFAGRYPQRCLSLTAVDATAWYGAEAPAAWEARASKARQSGMRALVEFQLARWFSESFLAAQPVLAREAIDVFLANRVEQYAASCTLLGQADERPALDAYMGPVALVVGEHDYATPVAMSQAMAERLANGKLTVVSGTRHYTPLEAPGEVAACIAEAMRRAEVRA